MTNYDKLINTLMEVFMLDKPELDFGIYRIMNQKRRDIEKFLQQDLIPQVKQVLAENLSVDKQALQKELDEAVKQAQALGADPETLPKVQQLKARIGEAADIVGLENEVFSLLANFFKRYFDNGDFISMRRYKKDVYAIPYEGEEVKLHWANADQYYIKSSEYLKNYRFKLRNGKSVAFELVEASTEQNNNKIQGDKERRFALHEEKPVEIAGDELKIYFTYETMDKKVKQDDLLDEAFDTLKDKIGKAEYRDFLEALAPGSARTEKDKNRCTLQKHLKDYTAKNTFDYFIHKDLGGFLTRELDFYIKNEVLFIDDINTREEQEFLKDLSKIKAIKRIGEKIIAFLAQLENFQKKLWLKKKFVVETNYCITLDRVPEEFYEEIAGNERQIEEWIRLFAIDEIKGDLAKKGFSKPLSVEFLKQNMFMVLDTAFFSEDFKLKLIAAIDSFDARLDGVLINSENFQALNMLQDMYREQVQCIHIDPPYNTATSGFLYKNSYQHSSWLSLMYDRLLLCSSLLMNPGIFACHIDEYEMERLHILLEQSLLINAGTLVWDKGMPIAGANGLATQHEYVLFRTKGNARIRVKKKNIEFIHSKIRDILDKYGSVTKEGIAEYRNGLKSQTQLTKSEKTYDQFDETGKAFRSDNMSATDRRTNEKFYVPLNHPITGKACPVPEFGWRYTPESMSSMLEQGLILFGDDHHTMPRKKTYLENTPDSQMSTIFRSGSRGKTDLDNLNIEFPFAHAIDFYCYIIDASVRSNDTILDFFAGSGTTGHAVINLNREDGGNRKYILVEMGTYFDTVTKPRIQKVIYSKDWRDGKPVSREGISHCFKYIRLESYEDALNNLALKPSDSQQLVLENNPSFKEGYMLNYMLDVEAQDSLLNLDWFRDPFNCYLNITRNSEMQPTKVDLVETFNYLIGLVVDHTYAAKGYRIVTGRNLQGEKILVVWRNVDEHNSTDLNKFLSKSKYNPLDAEFDRIYVNSDNNVENLKTGDERWKVVLIEEEFKKRMFEEVQ